jgi:kinesin family protein 5
MNGYNGTIMAYGQTGSGKTYTIFGKKSSMEYNRVISADTGVIPRAVRQIFESIKHADEKIQFNVKVSFLQVYMETITDLIQEDSEEDPSQWKDNMVFTANSKKAVYNLKEGLQIREDPKTGIFVKGLKQIVNYDNFRESLMKRNYFF